jgi:RNA polymerase sigma-70 factor (ECF subfamily)
MRERDPSRVTGLDSVSDGELVRLALENNGDAFRTIMTRHNRRLYRLARAVVDDDAEAEDIVQEAYVLAFTNLGTFRGEAGLATWLMRITLNEARRRLRRRRPAVDLAILDSIQGISAQPAPFPSAPPPDDPERATAQREIRRLLERAIDDLPEPFRIVFVMRDVEDMSIAETAALLGLRQETVKTRLHRARLLLRRALAEQLASSLTGVFPFAGTRCARVTDDVMRRFVAFPPAGGG